MNSYFIMGCLVWGIIIFAVYFLRPKSYIHSVKINIQEGMHKRLLLFTMIGVTLTCTVPMGLCPVWNGEVPGHRNQYEIMAESILNGHLYMDYEVDPKLCEMDNPYDRNLRLKEGVSYHWDHAFYNGHYYMYFGVVPVFLLFLPYRVITGNNLTTFHATQIFVTFFIIGMFALFFLLTKNFFKNLTFIMYLMLSSAFAIISVWYSVAAPALYTTAITSGICMEIWSLYFFIKAVWDTENNEKKLFYLFWGSLFGALSFGCRPPIALANILVLPILVKFLHNKKIDLLLIKQLVFVALPYIVVACLLMLYNYLRFDNPFEFGQAYQLTIQDQSGYGNFFEQFNIIKVLNGIMTNFISFIPLNEKFPYISHNGALINFPIFFFTIIALSRDNIRKELKNKGFWELSKALFILPIVITVFDVLWSPFIFERYRMDIYWLMGILCYIVIGFFYDSLSQTLKSNFSSLITIGALVTLFSCFLLWVVPYDSNLTSYKPEVLQSIEKIFKLGLS